MIIHFILFFVMHLLSNCNSFASTPLPAAYSQSASVNRYASVHILMNEEDAKQTKITFEKGKYAGVIVTQNKNEGELPSAIKIINGQRAEIELTWQLKTAFYDAKQLVTKALHDMGYAASKSPFVIGNILENGKLKKVVISYPLPKN